MIEKRYDISIDKKNNVSVKDNLTGKKIMFLSFYNHTDAEKCKISLDELFFDSNELWKINKKLRDELILANAFIKMIENLYEDASIEDILYMKYGESWTDELTLQIAISHEEMD